MSFDDDPEDIPNFPCERCPGAVYKNPSGLWECDDCDFIYEPKGANE